ncbi:MAG: hypothetical protein FWG89_11085 [Treponema sp.]|nr:hypothetical protein [Treponema sp.]
MNTVKKKWQTTGKILCTFLAIFTLVLSACDMGTSETPPLPGSLEISGVLEIGSMLTAAYTQGCPVFNENMLYYQWTRDGNEIDGGLGKKSLPLLGPGSYSVSISYPNYVSLTSQTVNVISSLPGTFPSALMIDSTLDHHGLSWIADSGVSTPGFGAFYQDWYGRPAVSVVGITDEGTRRELSKTNADSTIGFENDITDFIDEYSVVSFWIYVHGSDVTRDRNFTFELRTGRHDKETTFSQHVAWTAPGFMVRLENNYGVTGYMDSGWVNIRFPLENFQNAGGIPITALEQIVITGWRIAMAGVNCNIFISTIELVEP